MSAATSGKVVVWLEDHMDREYEAPLLKRLREEESARSFRLVLLPNAKIAPATVACLITDGVRPDDILLIVDPYMPPISDRIQNLLSILLPIYVHLTGWFGLRLWGGVGFLRQRQRHPALRQIPAENVFVYSHYIDPSRLVNLNKIPRGEWARMHFEIHNPDIVRVMELYETLRTTLAQLGVLSRNCVEKSHALSHELLMARVLERTA